MRDLCRSVTHPPPGRPHYHVSGNVRSRTPCVHMCSWQSCHLSRGSGPVYTIGLHHFHKIRTVLTFTLVANVFFVKNAVTGDDHEPTPSFQRRPHSCATVTHLLLQESGIALTQPFPKPRWGSGSLGLPCYCSHLSFKNAAV